MPDRVVTRTLRKNIAAILVAEQNEPALGRFRQLPAGSRIQICGAGFNEETVKVRCADELYFVFRNDVNSGH